MADVALVTEYLVVIEKQVNEGLYRLCGSAGDLARLLGSAADLEVGQGRIVHEDAATCTYQVTYGEVQGQDLHYFRVTLTSEGDEDAVQDYVALLRAVRQCLGGAGAQLETLRDDVSLFYARQAYPLIHRAENLMRRLISEFMLTSVGTDWIDVATPTEFRRTLQQGQRSDYRDPLHRVDFKDLGDLLFRPYQTGQVRQLYELIDAATQSHELDLDQLKTFVPRSNWDRYFRTIVACDGDFLETRWSALYELRCRIAHNALVSRVQLERIKQLVAEVTDPLEKAIEGLSSVYVPEEDREQVAAAMASRLDKLYGEFIFEWKRFEAALAYAAEASAMPLEPRRHWTSPMRLLEWLYRAETIDEDTFEEAQRLYRLRNVLLHDPEVEIDEQALAQATARLTDLTAMLRLRWKDELVTTLRALGGKAHLSDIYLYIEERTTRRLPATWKATVRYTLQVHCPETDTHKHGGESLFTQLGEGWWALRDYSEIDTAAPRDPEED